MAIEQLLQDGIAAARAGDIPRAQSLLSQVVQADPASEQGWWWLGFCMTAPDQREFCFRRVLALNPDHASARRQLDEIARLAASPDGAAVVKGPAAGTEAAAPAPARPASPEPRPPSREASAPDSSERPNRPWVWVVAGISLLGVCTAGGLVLYGLISNQINQLVLSAIPAATAPVARGPAPTAAPSRPTARPPTPVPTPTAAGRSRILADAIPTSAPIVDLAAGTGPVTLPVSDYNLFHFRAVGAPPFQSVQSLTFRVMGPHAGAAPLQLYVWSMSDNQWGTTLRLNWGDNPLDHPEQLVSPAGDIYASVRNLSEQAVTLDSMGFNLVVQNADGTETTYGPP